MKRVTGIGGIFFKARNPPALRRWHQQHLGIALEEWGAPSSKELARTTKLGAASGAGVSSELEGRPGPVRAFEEKAPTVWSLFDDTSTYFAPSTADHITAEFTTMKLTRLVTFPIDPL